MISKSKAIESVIAAKAASSKALSPKGVKTRKPKKPSAGVKRPPHKKVAEGIMTAESVLVSLTPAMRKELREAMQSKGGVNIRLEPTGEISLGRILRAYPVWDPPV